MKPVGKVIFALVLAAVAVQPSWSDPLLIVADEWPQMEILAAFLQEKGGYSIEKVEQNGLPDDLSGYAGVFEFVHGILLDSTAERLIRYAQHGGRVIVLHHGISQRKAETKGWFEVLGMKLDGRPEAQSRYTWIHDADVMLVNLQPRHYITSHQVTYPKTVEYTPSDTPSAPGDYPALEFAQSEVFLNHQFTDGREKTVLFGVRYTDPKSGTLWMQDRGGWYKPVGHGWIFYFTPGHTVEDFQQSAYCQIICNSRTSKL